MSSAQHGTRLAVEVRSHATGALQSVLYMPFMAHEPTDGKQGFTAPVLASLDLTYTVLYNGDLPRDWVIEFSDPLFGNRWEPDQLRLTVPGRDCPEILTSQ